MKELQELTEKYGTPWKIDSVKFANIVTPFFFGMCRRNDWDVVKWKIDGNSKSLETHVITPEGKKIAFWLINFGQKWEVYIGNVKPLIDEIDGYLRVAPEEAESQGVYFSKNYDEIIATQKSLFEPFAKWD